MSSHPNRYSPFLKHIPPKIPNLKTMAYSEHFADRIRRHLNQKGIPFLEKRMMGGLTFMVDDKMCVGLTDERLMARIGPDAEAEALQKPGARPMAFTGRVMKGFVHVDPVGTDRDDDLAYFLDLALAYNPIAPKSKKKKKKT